MFAQGRTTTSISVFEESFEPACMAKAARALKHRVRKHLRALAFGVSLLVVSACNFLVNLDTPTGPFWDEAYYLTTTARYSEGRAQFASHPPLGLMLIAAGAAVSGANRGVDTGGLAAVKSVGDAALPARYQIWGTRLASAVFGMAVVMTVYGLLLASHIDVFLAAAVALLVAVETAFVVQFRAAQLDAFEVEFGVLCIGVLATVARRRPSLMRARAFAVAGLAAGAAMMVKLDGVLLLTAPAALIIPTLIRRCRNPRSLGTASIEGLAFSIAALLVVAATYTVQSLVCDQPLDYGAPAAATDARFMSLTYQHYLDGRLGWSPRVVAAAAEDSLRYMLNDQAGVGRIDPNGASPWLAPLGVKPINYRWDSDNGLTRYVQLIPNPINWALSASALLISSALLVARPFAGRRGIRPSTAMALAPIVATALVFYLAHGVLGGRRVMYLYHGFLTEILGVLCVPFLVKELAARRPAWKGRLEAGVWITVTASAAAFMWFFPLAYARPLTHGACELRNTPLYVVACRG